MYLRAALSVQVLFVVVHSYVYINDHGDQNCSSLLNNQSASGHHNQLQCPPWFFPDNLTGTCIPGSSLDGLLELDLSMMQTHVMQCNCMTEKDGVFSVGFCLHKCSHIFSYYSLPCNISELEDASCPPNLNRHGLICRQCKHGFGISAYSYSLACVECVDYKYNWMKYIAVVYVPLTLFYIFVTLFSINFTSVAFTSVVMLCQVCSNPLLARLVLSSLEINTPLYMYEITKIVITFTSVWNLDFFRAYYSFCLHPDASESFILALEFAKALYPLLLIAVTSFMVKLHDNNFKFVIWGWKVVSLILKPIRYNVETSLVKVFSTFIYLSSSQILLTSMMFLVPCSVYSYHQRFDGKTVTRKTYHSFLSETDYFVKGNAVYALISVVFSTAIFTTPVLLLLFYPFSCFHRILNRIGLNSLALHTFVDVFQGSYKDGTNGTRDYRCFSGFILIFPLIIYVTFAFTKSTFYYPFTCIFILIYATMFIIFRPLRHTRHNWAVAGMLLSLTVFFMFTTLHNLSYPLNYKFSVNGAALNAILLIIPLVFIFVLFSVLVVNVYRGTFFYRIFK